MDLGSSGDSPRCWRGSVDSTWVLQIGYKGMEMEKVKGSHRVTVSTLDFEKVKEAGRPVLGG